MVEMDAPSITSPQATSNVVLRTRRLSKRYGSRMAVRGLSLEVERGDVFGLLGPNGSGKTTTLRMVLGLIWPTAGSITLFGTPAGGDGHRRELLQRVGAIIEQPSFYPYLTGRQNLRVVARFAGQPNTPAMRKRIDEALEQVDLGPRAKDAYRKYSLGMKQRLGIAAALLTDPELLILDEPTNGLDPAGVVEIRNLIGELARRGMTVVLSSHLLHEVQQVCTRVAILQEGSLLTQGRVADLLAASRGLVVGFDRPGATAQAAEALAEASRGAAPWLHGVQYLRPETGAWTPPDGWLMVVDAPVERASELTALLAERGLYVAELRRREVSLEQYFLDLTNTGPAAEASPVPAAVSFGARGGQA